MAERTILDLYRHEAETPRTQQYWHHVPGREPRVLSTGDFLAAAASLADGLAGLGVARGDRVAVLSDNRPEWHIADIAVLSLGAADVPLYPTLTPPQIAYQVRDSGAVAAIVDTPEQVAKLLSIRGDCPALEHIIQIEPGAQAGVLTLDEVRSRAGDGAVDRFWQRASAIGEDDLATIVYTSGTTGEPKGAMLTHRNIVSNVLAVRPVLSVTGQDLALEFLPMCHVYERTAGYVYMFHALPRAYCATAQVGELIAIIKPTLFCSVPRVFEKVHNKILAKVEAAPPVRRKLFAWAVGVGKQAAQHRLAGRRLPPGLAVRHRLADRLVLHKVRQALGGRVRMSLSGAAPLPAYVNEFFHGLGISVQEGYGLTETSPVISANGWRPGSNRLGSVGRPLDGVEVRIAPDGELCVRGPNVFKGYWNKPEHTADVFDDDGFFHTGDIARVDDDGFIHITDRKKDLIITAGGKNVAPQPIENILKQSRYIENAVLIGDRKPFIVALISPNADELEAWARGRGIEYRSLADLVQRPEAAELYNQALATANGELARYEQIKGYRVVPRPFSVEGGQLTPTMKVKRRVVEKEYADLIADLYRSAQAEAV